MGTKRKIYFRADAGPEIGYGHYIRSLALADMLKQDFECTMFTQSPTEYQLNEAKDICPIVALPADNSKFGMFLDQLQGDEIVVLDNYFFSTDYQRAIKAKGSQLVCIDDMHDKHYVADAIINQGMGYSRQDYSLESYTSLYLGIEYSLLRKPFLSIHDAINTPRTKGSIIVAFGGSDPNNLTEAYIAALLERPEIQHIDAIIGDSYRGRLSDSPKVQYHKNLSAEQIRDMFLHAEYALLPASTMMREAMACGIKIIGGYYIDNQMHDYETYAQHHYIYVIGDMLKSSTIQQFRELPMDESLFENVIWPKEYFMNIPERFIKLFKNV